MKKIISFLILFALVLSCTSNTIYKKPDDLIERDLMIELITQMQIANAARSSKNLNNERSVDYMSVVHEKYGIDSAQFARSNFYYSTTIDDYTKMMQSVKLELTKMKDIQDSIVKVMDSIKREETKLKRLETKKRRKEKDSIDLANAIKRKDSLVK